MNRNNLIFAVAIAAFFLQPAIAWSIPAEQPIAEVTAFVGEVFVRSQVKPPLREWARIARIPMPIFNGDEVRTQRGRAEVVFPNKDTIRLAEYSVARFTVSEEVRRRFLIFRRMVLVEGISTTYGRIWGKVRPEKGKEVKFASPVTVATVAETVLEFNYDPPSGRSFVGVTEGEVKVTAAGVTVVLGPKQATIVKTARPPTRPFAYLPSPAPEITEAALREALRAPPPFIPPPPEVPIPVAGALAPIVAAALPYAGGGGLGIVPPPVMPATPFR